VRAGTENAQHELESEHNKHYYAEEVKQGTVAVGDDAIDDFLDIDRHREGENGREHGTDEGLGEHALVGLEQAPKSAGGGDGVVAGLEIFARCHQNEDPGPDGFKFLVRPFFDSAHRRVHDAGKLGGPGYQYDKMEPLLVN
jgi:hypothetical protein